MFDVITVNTWTIRVGLNNYPSEAFWRSIKTVPIKRTLSFTFLRCGFQWTVIIWTARRPLTSWMTEIQDIWWRGCVIKYEIKPLSVLGPYYYHRLHPATNYNCEVCTERWLHIHRNWWSIFMIFYFLKCQFSTLARNPGCGRKIAIFGYEVVDT